MIKRGVILQEAVPLVRGCLFVYRGRDKHLNSISETMSNLESMSGEDLLAMAGDMMVEQV